ncbi:unnamed protein product, partial [Medioppia subpectinata]
MLVLVMTFMVYCAAHLARKPISIVKSQLHSKNCTESSVKRLDVSHLDPNWCDWSPFDTQNADQLLGWLDTSFLASYAVFMFVSGYVAERSNLRWFLAISLGLCGVLSILAGLPFSLQIHAYYYFIIVQVITGIVQTSAWPAVVTAVGNWFGDSKKGLLFGIWGFHTTLGNILGALIAGAFVEYNWGLSFIVPGIIAIAVAVVCFLFLIPCPQDVGLSADANDSHNIESNNTNGEEIVTIDDNVDNTAISFFGALLLPGVIEYSVCLFFSKLVTYTFMYWLPLYINNSIKVSPSQSAYLSISFDIGGTVGAILAGYMADVTNASAITCIVFIILTIPSLLFYYYWGSVSMVSNECLQFIAGLFVNGPYNLITTAVSADLAINIKSKSALATVSAIIDGTGSIGAAVGPAIAGYVEGFGWGRRVSEAVARRAEATGGGEKSVKLVAASKTQPPEKIVEAYRCGQRVFGENYIQELCAKSADPLIVAECPHIEWRLIGHIQTNKINQLLRVDRLTAVETIDSPKLAQSLEKALSVRNRTLEVMVQINSGDEDVKTGCHFTEAEALARLIRADCPHLKLTGLMTVGRFGHDWSAGPNPDFLAFVGNHRSICEGLAISESSLELSFGMTADFEEAIGLGSDEVRVGTALFGE